MKCLKDGFVKASAKIFLADELDLARWIPDEWPQHPANLAAEKQIAGQPCEENFEGNGLVARDGLGGVDCTSYGVSSVPETISGRRQRMGNSRITGVAIKSSAGKKSVQLNSVGNTLLITDTPWSATRNASVMNT